MNPQRLLDGFDSQNKPGATSASTSPPEPGSLDQQTVVVIDALGLIYQVYHALPEMTGPNGQPVNAIHGFTRDILDLLERPKGELLFCAFDHSARTFRHDLYPDYKGNRSPMPDDLRCQIPDIQRMLGALGIPVLTLANYEADDIMATVACETETRGGRCVLVTSDKDCRQLINEQIEIYNIRKDTSIGVREVVDDWGIRPDQVVDFQALWGDAVDNVPGVEGIGKKTAADLLHEYETLDGILDNAEAIKAKKRRENLIRDREQALLSRELVRLDPRVPIPLDWSAARIGGIDSQQVAKLCAEFGFRRLGERLANLTVQSAPTDWTTHYELIQTPNDLEALVARLSALPRFSLDTETTSKNPRHADLVGLSFAWGAGKACYIPVRAPEGDPQLDLKTTLEALRPILENDAIEKIGQNLKYEMIVLRGNGIDLQGPLFDTMVADYLLVPGERNHSLDELAKRYLNHQTISIKQLIGTGKKQIRMDQVPVDQVLTYAAEDADVPWRLVELLGQKLRDQGLYELFRDVEMPLVSILADMEFAGIQIDVERLDDLHHRYADKLIVLKSEIHDLAGDPFNIDSPKQLAAVLFDKLGLPVIKRTKTGPSTDAEVLAQLSSDHSLPAKVVEYRQIAKLKSTYVDALPLLVHEQTHRVHTSFRQDVAATGRLSSTEPNLQNIPIRTAEGREIRAAFVPGHSGWHLITADYSQVELRVLANLSADETLLQAFQDDQDIHARVASEVFRVELADVTSEMRRSAKAVNFGIIYGQSPFGLAKSLDIDVEEAAVFIDSYFEKIPRVQQFVDRVLEECRDKGYVTTIFGRRREIQGVRSSSKRGDSRQRSLPERIAINTVIQGSAADLIKHAMIRVDQRLRREQLAAQMLLQIHDELVFEAPVDQVPHLAEIVTEEMVSCHQLSVPLSVDVKSGPNWAECE
ncbi:MAG: DNA polymerase I [Planctomycetaceae bacterium]|nr:DNA polymerase I [Planctomycetaceae bacterium]